MSNRYIAGFLPLIIALQACSVMTSDPETTQSTAPLPVRVIDNPRPDNTLIIEAKTVSYDNLWQRIQQGLEFSLIIEDPSIEEELENFASNQEYLNQVSESASPFLYEIVNEIERRQLPMELALLPAIESAYESTATSAQDASGLWQFMSPTASSMGLKQDWWYDGRNDPLASTHAALDYLELLNQHFDGDWLLTIAAYNAGQGTVQRAIRNNRDNGKGTDFWSLSLPRETRNHIPKLLGLAQLLAQAENFAITLPVISNKPVIMQVDPGRQIDLALAAELAALDIESIYQLNPAYKQWATHPDGPHTLLLPTSNAERLQSALQELGHEDLVTWDRYLVRSGDTLSTIARRFHTQVGILQQINRMQGSRIIAGESLLVPRNSNSGNTTTQTDSAAYFGNTAVADPGQMREYFVQQGDSLWRIARRYRVSVADITRLNNIDQNSLIRPGQQLRIP
ncbi:MAG: LysM peptidoglycan-binding domain-containing protein [Pseudomonadales bacterium]|nr:LysM peptidoglycan-binding domain-containing protein [Pseudomonadales bacterium]